MIFQKGRVLAQDALIFSLELREQALSGSATAMTPSNEKLPNALSHWVKLKKQPADP